jgi:hypothetical protein
LGVGAFWWQPSFLASAFAGSSFRKPIMFDKPSGNMGNQADAASMRIGGVPEHFNTPFAIAKEQKVVACVTDRF